MKELDFYHLKITRNAMFGSRFYIRILGRKCADKNTVALYIRIIQDGEAGQIVYSTGLKCKKRHFNARKQIVSDSEVNHLVQAEKLRVYKLIYRAIEHDGCVRMDAIKKQLKNKTSKETVHQLCQLSLDENKQNISAKTHKQNTSLLTRFIEKISIGTKQADTLEPGLLEEALMKGKQCYKHASFIRVVCLLKNAFLYGKRKELIKNNPFERINYRMITQVTRQKPEKEVPEYQSILKKIQDNIQKNRTIHDDFALFQLQTGIAFCDVQALCGNMVVESNGSHFIIKNRNKTNTQFFVPISEDVKQLYDHHSGFQSVEYPKYNKYLKDHYSITTHCLRHARARELLTGVCRLKPWHVSWGTPPSI